MRHIIGSSEPDFIIGSVKDRNRRCRKKDKDHMVFLCELCEAQVAPRSLHRARADVRCEFENEKSATKIMAMPGTRTTVTDLCMFGVAACDEGGPGFV